MGARRAREAPTEETASMANIHAWANSFALFTLEITITCIVCGFGSHAAPAASAAPV